MSPKAIQYKTNSIIFFKGDSSDLVYILNSGRVVLNYIDIETGQEVHDLIQTGEFFGVKSALGKYSREETALVLQDASVIAFSVPEFEQLVMKNTRIIVKMLKVFSNQLRRIHKQVQNLLYSEQQTDPETGLYKIGDYYLGNKHYNQALYAYKRYLVYYPSGNYSDEVTKKIQLAENNLSKFGQGKGNLPKSVQTTLSGKQQKTAEMSDSAKRFFNAVSLVSQKKFETAISSFKRIVNEGVDKEYVAKAEYEIGKCQYHLREYDTCIESLTSLIQKYPTHPELKEALFYIGQCNDEKNDKSKARDFYIKIISMTKENEPMYRKVKKALDALDG